MLRFAANLTTLFNDLDFLERFEAAAAAGFSAVECQFPYEHDKKEIAARLKANGLIMVLHNMPAGDWAAGDCGIACQPEHVDEFRQGVDRAIDYASSLGCSQVNCLAGVSPDDSVTDVVEATLLENLNYAGEKLQAAGIRLLIEPINKQDRPGFYLNTTDQALALIERSRTANLWLQCDVYHMHRMGENITQSLQRALERMAHVQISDSPGRCEPGAGEIDFPFLFDYLDEIGYQGWVGCEFTPSGHSSDGLDWYRHLRATDIGT